MAKLGLWHQRVQKNGNEASIPNLDTILEKNKLKTEGGAAFDL